jgi:hypothetical protein
MFLFFRFPEDARLCSFLLSLPGTRKMSESSPATPTSSASAAARLLLWVAAVTALACYLSFFISRRTFALSAGRPSAFWTLFREEEPIASAVALVLLALGLVIASLAPGKLFAAVERLGTSPWPLIATFAAGAATAAWFVYSSYPLCMDEYAAWFQAKAFAAGRLTGRVPPELVPWVVPGFKLWFLEAARDGRIVSAYWPGFALLLAPFAALGVPWLLNPLIGAASLVVLWRLAGKLLPGKVRGCVLLFAVASPVFLVDSISFYSMSAHLLFSLLFADLLTGEPTARRTAFAGVVGSFALVLHNPVPHVLFAAPWIVWVARQPRKRHLPALLLGYLPLTVLLGAGWTVLRAQIQSASPGVHPPMTLLKLAAEFYELAFAIPDPAVFWARAAGFVKLVLWASPGMVVLSCIGAAMVLRDRSESATPLRLLTQSALLTLVAYFFFPQDQGHGWGYRYFHSAWGVLPLLAAVPIVAPEFARVERVLVATALASLLLAVPLRLVQVQSFIDRQRAQIPEAPAGAREVVFVRPDRGFYTQDLVQNDPFLRGKRLILFSHGDEADAALASRLKPRPTLAGRNQVATVWVVK